ncbi:MAG TPA: hypothetical protein VN655_03515 [Pseudolabrys sp.]|nr:hypothetical protein [Pseudolabrys sp.]
MNIASLALATALAAILGCAQPAFAQTQDQTGATNPDSMNNGAGDDGNGNSRSWAERRSMTIGPMWRHRRMMIGAAGAGGAHFHFARGKARIDVTCSVQEDTEACVRAAGQLIDKIAELRGGGPDRDNTTGAAGSGERAGPSSNESDDTGAPGERM